MNKENILYSVVGLLLGYVLAFTYATHRNLNDSGVSTKNARQEAGLTSGQPEVDPELEAMRERLTQIEAQAREQADNFDLQMEAAELNFELQRYEESIDFLEQALRLRPDDFRVLVGLAGLNEATGRYEMAEHWYREAIKKNPDNLDLRNFLGMTYLRRKPSNVEKAIDEFRVAFAQNPSDELTLQNLTTALAQKAKDEAADKAARKKTLKEADEMLAKLESVNPANPAIEGLRDTLSRTRTSLDGAAGRGRS